MNPRLPFAFVLACLLAFAPAGLALAHAELEESDPADGETIHTPATFTAVFNEELDAERSRIVVRNAAGEEVARGGVSDTDAEVMTVDLPTLPDGEYAARWTAVTPDDGGVTRGTITFIVVTPPPSPSPSLAPATARPTPTEAVPATTPPAAETLAPATTSPSPAASPSASPADGEPTAGVTDLLLALVLAGAVVGGLALYLLRRR